MKILVNKFSASWCTPCKVYKPTFDKIKEVYKNNPNIEFNEPDIDELDPDSVAKYGIRSIPTTIIETTEGKILFRKSGVLSESELLTEITKALNS